MKNEKDVLEYFIENERKQKRTTLIVSILFSFFAITIIVLGINAYNQKEIINLQNGEILDLKGAIALKDSLLKLKDENDKYYKDSLSNKRIIKNEYYKDSISDNQYIEYNNNYQPTNSIAVDTSNNKDYPNKEVKYTIYIQYMDGLYLKAKKIRTFLNKKNYKVPETDLIIREKFSSSVRYFYPTDNQKATEIARLAEIATNTKYKVQYTKIKAPKNQIEIWIGK